MTPPTTNPIRICTVKEGRYQGRRSDREGVELIEHRVYQKARGGSSSPLLDSKEWQRSREVVEIARWSGRSTFSTARACAQLRGVPESSRMHIMRASARMVASAESLHFLPQTALCDRRSCQGRLRFDARGVAHPREVVVALSRTVAVARRSRACFVRRRRNTAASSRKIRLRCRSLG